MTPPPRRLRRTEARRPPLPAIALVLVAFAILAAVMILYWGDPFDQVPEGCPPNSLCDIIFVPLTTRHTPIRG